MGSLVNKIEISREYVGLVCSADGKCIACRQQFNVFKLLERWIGMGIRFLECSNDLASIGWKFSPLLNGCGYTGQIGGMRIKVFDEHAITKIISDQPGEHSGVIVIDVSTGGFQI